MTLSLRALVLSVAALLALSPAVLQAQPDFSISVVRPAWVASDAYSFTLALQRLSRPSIPVTSTTLSQAVSQTDRQLQTTPAASPRLPVTYTPRLNLAHLTEYKHFFPAANRDTAGYSLSLPESTAHGNHLIVSLPLDDAYLAVQLESAAAVARYFYEPDIEASVEPNLSVAPDFTAGIVERGLATAAQLLHAVHLAEQAAIAELEATSAEATVEAELPMQEYWFDDGEWETALDYFAEYGCPAHVWSQPHRFPKLFPQPQPQPLLPLPLQAEADAWVMSSAELGTHPLHSWIAHATTEWTVAYVSRTEWFESAAHLYRQLQAGYQAELLAASLPYEILTPEAELDEEVVEHYLSLAHETATRVREISSTLSYLFWQFWNTPTKTAALPPLWR